MALPQRSAQHFPQSASGASEILPELESLRGIAISLVVLMHAEGMINGLGAFAAPWLSPWRAYVLGGHTGVSLFFILSGFLLSRPFLVEASGGRRVARSTYCARRGLRILPLYYTAVVAGTLWCMRQPSDLAHGLPYLVFMNSFEGMTTKLPPFSYVWWSLATEMQFYLVLPFLPLFLRSQRGRWLGAGCALAYAMAYAAFVLGAMHLSSFEANNRLVHSLLGRAPLFALGALAAALHARKGQQLERWAADRSWMQRGGADALLLLVLLALGMLLRHVVYFNYFDYEIRYPAWHLLEGSLWTMTVLLVLLAPLRTKPLLSNRILRTLGRLSYSIYLVHVPVLMLGLAAVRARWPNLITGWTVAGGVVFTLLCAICLTISTVTYLAIERPMLRAKARLRRWSVPRSSAVARDEQIQVPQVVTTLSA